jgi:hypothetical protein
LKSPALQAADTRPAQSPARVSRLDPGRLTACLLLIAGASIALSVDIVRVGYSIKGDEATYVSMALSAAQDGDLAFDRGDLLRFWTVYQRGPEGIFLKRGKEVDVSLQGGWPFVRVERTREPEGRPLYYGKAFVYPVAVAPLVWIAGLNGMLLFHVLLLVGVFLGGYYFLLARSEPLPALLLSLAFVGASITPLYAVWLTPEVFNVALVFFAYFLWVYKEVAPPASDGAWARFLRGRGSDLAAAVLIGIAAYSKPTNLPLVAPLVLLRWWRRDWVNGFLIGCVCAVVTATSFGLTARTSGEFNYQGGDRRTFYGRFPFESATATFETRGVGVATDELREDILLERQVFWERTRDNVLYFFVGRHAGLVPYYFPGIVILVLVVWKRREMRVWQVLSLGVLAVTAGVLLLWLPFTWAGGGGPPGNRYFLSLYPVMLFLAPPLRRSLVPGLVAWTGGALFTAHILINPFVSSSRPYIAPRQGVLPLLPVEMTMVNDLPIMINSGRARIPYGEPRMFLYFLDENAWLPERAGIWVAGRSKTEIIFRSGEQFARLDVTLHSLVPNRVTLSAGTGSRTVQLEPNTLTTVSLQTRGWYARSGVGTLLTVETSDGAVPRLLDPAHGDTRFLGVLMQLRGVGTAVGRP